VSSSALAQNGHLIRSFISAQIHFLSPDFSVVHGGQRVSFLCWFMCCPAVFSLVHHRVEATDSSSAWVHWSVHSHWVFPICRCPSTPGARRVPAVPAQAPRVCLPLCSPVPEIHRLGAILVFLRISFFSAGQVRLSVVLFVFCLRFIMFLL
jgi:hypothetical protein